MVFVTTVPVFIVKPRVLGMCRTDREENLSVSAGSKGTGESTVCLTFAIFAVDLDPSCHSFYNLQASVLGRESVVQALSGNISLSFAAEELEE